MACGKGNLMEDEKNRNAAETAVSSSVVVNDAVIFATMCIIGMPVDVHTIDGSVYSGIFYTACVDSDYAIVLKNARMIKMGNQEANVVKGCLMDTLIVPSENFVQVVAKDVRLPANGITGSGGRNGMEDSIVGYKDYPEMEAKVIIKPNESGGDKKHKNQTRPVDGPQEIQRDSKNISELQDERISVELQVSSPSTATMTISEKTDIQESLKMISAGYSTTREDQANTGPTSDGTACSVGSSPKASATSTPSYDINTESCLRASSASYIPSMPPKSSKFQRTAKESTLNPGAKIFSPSILHHRSVTPPAMPNRACVFYMPDAAAMTPMACTQGVDISSFAHPSMPVKFVPYNNVAIGDGGHDASYFQPVIEQMLSRMQPVRYAGHYHDFETGPGYVQSNPQNVTLGRVGPLVCTHPIASDVVQSAARFSQPTSRSLITPHLPKNQGNASAQVLQLCMTPPIVANAPQQFVMPSSIPISQPLVRQEVRQEMGPTSKYNIQNLESHIGLFAKFAGRNWL